MFMKLVANCCLDINTLFDFWQNDGSKGSSCFRSGGHEESLPRAPTLADAIASLMNSGAEQAWLLQMVVHNSGNGGVHGIRNVV